MEGRVIEGRVMEGRVMEGRVMEEGKGEGKEKKMPSTLVCIEAFATGIKI